MDKIHSQHLTSNKTISNTNEKIVSEIIGDYKKIITTLIDTIEKFHFPANGQKSDLSSYDYHDHKAKQQTEKLNRKNKSLEQQLTEIRIAKESQHKRECAIILAKLSELEKKYTQLCLEQTKNICHVETALLSEKIYEEKTLSSAIKAGENKLIQIAESEKIISQTQTIVNESIFEYDMLVEELDKIEDEVNDFFSRYPYLFENFFNRYGILKKPNNIKKNKSHSRNTNEELFSKEEREIVHIGDRIKKVNHINQKRLEIRNRIQKNTLMCEKEKMYLKTESENNKEAHQQLLDKRQLLIKEIDELSFHQDYLSLITVEKQSILDEQNNWRTKLDKLNEKHAQPNQAENQILAEMEKQRLNAYQSSIERLNMIIIKLTMTKSRIDVIDRQLLQADPDLEIFNFNKKNASALKNKSVADLIADMFPEAKSGSVYGKYNLLRNGSLKSNQTADRIKMIEEYSQLIEDIVQSQIKYHAFIEKKYVNHELDIIQYEKMAEQSRLLLEKMSHAYIENFDYTRQALKKKFGKSQENVNTEQYGDGFLAEIYWLGNIWKKQYLLGNPQNTDYFSGPEDYEGNLVDIIVATGNKPVDVVNMPQKDYDAIYPLQLTSRAKYSFVDFSLHHCQLKNERDKTDEFSKKEFKSWLNGIPLINIDKYYHLLDCLYKPDRSKSVYEKFIASLDEQIDAIDQYTKTKKFDPNMAIFFKTKDKFIQLKKHVNPFTRSKQSN